MLSLLFSLLTLAKVATVSCSCFVNPPKILSARHFVRIHASIEDNDIRNSGVGGTGQSETPFVAALIHEAERIKAPFFFPGHGMGNGLAEDDPLFPESSPYRLSSTARGLLRFDLPELPDIGSVDADEGPLRDAQVAHCQYLYGSKKFSQLLNHIHLFWNLAGSGCVLL